MNNKNTIILNLKKNSALDKYCLQAFLNPMIRIKTKRSLIMMISRKNILLSQSVGWPESLTRYSYLIFTEISKMKFWIKN